MVAIFWRSASRHQPLADGLSCRGFHVLCFVVSALFGRYCSSSKVLTASHCSWSRLDQGPLRLGYICFGMYAFLAAAWRGNLLKMQVEAPGNRDCAVCLFPKHQANTRAPKPQACTTIRMHGRSGNVPEARPDGNQCFGFSVLWCSMLTTRPR